MNLQGKGRWIPRADFQLVPTKGHMLQQAKAQLYKGNGKCVHLEDGSSFQHFSHEGGHPPQLAVPRTHPGKDTVSDGNSRLVTWHKAAHLRH